MPYGRRPTLMELDDQLRADVVSRLPGTDPLLSRSYLGALIRAIAGGNHELYGYLDWIADQAFIDTAEGPELLRWAGIWGITPVAAVRAEGAILVEGEAARRSCRPARSGVADRPTSNTGPRLSSPCPAGGTGNIDIEAVAAGGSGQRGGRRHPVAGQPHRRPSVARRTSATALTGGADIETDASLRARLLERIQNPPRAGTSEDYTTWAKAGHPDVTRAWARPQAGGLGTVTVYFMTDPVFAADGTTVLRGTTNGIPNAATVTYGQHVHPGAAAGDRRR